MKQANFMMFVFCLIFSHSAFAEDKEHDRLTKQLMNMSGLVKQIGSIPDHIQGNLMQAQQQNGQLSQTQLKELNEAMASAYNAKSLLANTEHYINENLTSSDMRTILEWLNSDLGKKITRFEEEGSTAESAPKIMAIAADMKNQDPKRLDKIAKLDNAIKGTESAVAMIQGIQIAMTMGMMSGMPETERMSLEQLTKRVDSSSEQLYEKYKPQVSASYLYFYRDLTDSEIDQYINFATSKTATKYHAVTTSALSAALINASETLGENLFKSKTIN
ncbi:MAG: hypothetical protein ACN4GR_08995 [Arenicellales bacterium]